MTYKEHFERAVRNAKWMDQERSLQMQDWSWVAEKHEAKMKKRFDEKQATFEKLFKGLWEK